MEECVLVLRLAASSLCMHLDQSIQSEHSASKNVHMLVLNRCKAACGRFEQDGIVREACQGYNKDMSETELRSFVRWGAVGSFTLRV